MTAKAILFTSPTCGPCKSMKPLITEAAAAAGVPLEVFEVGKQSSLVAAFEIRAVPTLVLLDPNDKETKRMVGAASAVAIRDFFA